MSTIEPVAELRVAMMLQGDDHIIWGNLKRVLMVLVAVMFALVGLANFLS